MASYSDFMWFAPTADLVEQARAGNPSAIRELMQRRVPATEFLGRGAPQRNMARPAGMPAGLPGLERPAYLDRGISRDMARPGSEGPQPPPMDPTLAFGNRGRALTPAGLPGLEQPAYLGTGTPDQAPSPLQARMKPEMPAAQSEISALANGNDAAASIQRGAAQADEAAGVDTTSALPEPIRALTEAFANEEEDPYEGAAADLMKELTAGISPERNKNMALAQAGFAMAASGAPYFLQGVGIGGEAGLKAYTEAQDRDTLARIRAAQIGTDLSQTRETKRAHRAGEAIEVGKMQETAAENIRQQGRFNRTQAEVERHNQQAEADNRAMRALQAQGNALEAGRLEESRRQFEIMDDRYRRGEATENDLKKAQVDLARAQAKAAESLDLGRRYKLDETIIDGKPYLTRLNVETGESELYRDKKTGQPVQAAPKSTSGTALKLGILQQAGWSEQQIANWAAGNKPLTEAQIINSATNYANSKTDRDLNGMFDPGVWQQNYQEALGALSAQPNPQGGGTNTPEPEQRQQGDANTPPVEGARKAPDGNWYVADPARPGKYLKVE